MRRQLTAFAIAGAVALALTSSASAQIGNVLFQENFNGLVLGPSVNERQGTPNFALSTGLATDPNTQSRPNAFTHTPPSGWVVDNNFNNFGQTDLNNVNYFTGTIVGNTGVPNQGSAADGVDEWEGWSFANKNFWSSVDDQTRSSFTNASGTIAVADSDEYDDLGTGRGGGYMNTGLTTGSINVTAFAGMDVVLELDSSWRPEAFDDAHTGNPALAGGSLNNQTAIIYAAFDGNAPDPFSGQVDLFDSQEDDPRTPLVTDPSPTYKPDMQNEHISKTISVPAGAQSMKLTFAYINAANDWWWAIDNLKLSNSGNQFFSEDFESVTLGPSVNERQALVPTIPKITASNTDAATTGRPNSFTHTTPAGWTVDNSAIDPIAIGDNNRGVFEWEGWSFADRAFWAFASQGDANSFTKASGPFAIADSDEFADFGATNANDPPGTGDVTQPLTTVLQSPSINIAGLGANTLMMQFDSCWRPEGTTQAAEITVDYGSGPIVVLRWDSDPNSPNRHGTDASGAPNLNETVLIPLNNPAGANSAVVSFKYLNGNNNWFWAIDNIQVGVVPEPSSVALGAMAMVGLLAVAKRAETFVTLAEL